MIVKVESSVRQKKNGRTLAWFGDPCENECYSTGHSADWDTRAAEQDEGNRSGWHWGWGSNGPLCQSLPTLGRDSLDPLPKSLPSDQPPVVCGDDDSTAGQSRCPPQEKGAYQGPKRPEAPFIHPPYKQGMHAYPLPPRAPVMHVMHAGVPTCLQLAAQPMCTYHMQKQHI